MIFVYLFITVFLLVFFFPTQTSKIKKKCSNKGKKEISKEREKYTIASSFWISVDVDSGKEKW